MQKQKTSLSMKVVGISPLCELQFMLLLEKFHFLVNYKFNIMVFFLFFNALKSKFKLLL